LVLVICKDATTTCKTQSSNNSYDNTSKDTSTDGRPDDNLRRIVYASSRNEYTSVIPAHTVKAASNDRTIGRARVVCINTNSSIVFNGTGNILRHATIRLNTNGLHARVVARRAGDRFVNASHHRIAGVDGAFVVIVAVTFIEGNTNTAGTRNACSFDTVGADPHAVRENLARPVNTLRLGTRICSSTRDIGVCAYVV